MQNDYIEIFREYDNLSENKLNEKSNKRVYVRNDIMTHIIKHCRGKTKTKQNKTKKTRKKI